ncbi:hypothetical protein M7I_5892 [Glarea lozoyensis 74030]|uniref:Uncharacterized protein n=1 Tax=Glarea lozoyensis (strain ATCC 74030 / MF5533) TaxID=1104152 RepID=H0ET38_GLAL7|nr:hypothetical protein M7I_5892 [Glarea lozoyensis 74030]
MKYRRTTVPGQRPEFVQDANPFFQIQHEKDDATQIRDTSISDCQNK